jgi:hypothetical protein
LFGNGAGNILPDEREIYPEWFEVDDREQCSEVPSEVKTGRPKDLCGDVSNFCKKISAET